MAVSRSSLVLPQLQQELVIVPELGGELIVRRLPLRDTLTLKKLDNEDSILWSCGLLAKCVLCEDGEPALTSEQWEVFFLSHQSRFLEVFAIVARLSGFAMEEAEKK